MHTSFHEFCRKIKLFRQHFRRRRVCRTYKYMSMGFSVFEFRRSQFYKISFCSQEQMIWGLKFSVIRDIVSDEVLPISEEYYKKFRWVVVFSSDKQFVSLYTHNGHAYSWTWDWSMKHLNKIHSFNVQNYSMTITSFYSALDFVGIVSTWKPIYINLLEKTNLSYPSTMSNIVIPKPKSQYDKMLKGKYCKSISNILYKLLFNVF